MKKDIPVGVSFSFLVTMYGLEPVKGPPQNCTAIFWGGAMVSCSDPTRAASQRAKLIGAKSSPRGGSKQRKRVNTLFLFLRYPPYGREPVRGPQRNFVAVGRSDG